MFLPSTMKEGTRWNINRNTECSRRNIIKVLKLPIWVGIETKLVERNRFISSFAIGFPFRSLQNWRRGSKIKGRRPYSSSFRGSVGFRNSRWEAKLFRNVEGGTIDWDTRVPPPLSSRNLSSTGLPTVVKVSILSSLGSGEKQSREKIDR